MTVYRGQRMETFRYQKPLNEIYEWLGERLIFVRYTEMGWTEVSYWRDLAVPAVEVDEQPEGLRFLNHCIVCREKMYAYSDLIQFCSHEWDRRWRAMRMRARRDHPGSRSVVCAQCRARFTAHRCDAKFCSSRCRTAASRASTKRKLL